MKAQTTRNKIAFTPEDENDIYLIGYMSAKNSNTIKFVEATSMSPKIDFISFEIKDVIKALMNNNLSL